MKTSTEEMRRESAHQVRDAQQERDDIANEVERLKTDNANLRSAMNR